MNRVNKKFFACLVVFIIIVPLIANNSSAQFLDFSNVRFDFPGNSAKANAMGGAFIAVANDGSAIAWNPAGLAQMRYSETSLSMRMNLAAFDIQSPEIFGDSLTFTASPSTQFLLNYVSIIFPFKIKNKELIGGIAIRNLSDAKPAIRWNMIDLQDTTETVINEKNEGGLYSSSVAVSSEIFKGFYLGSTINFITGRNNQKFNLTRSNFPGQSQLIYAWNNKFSGYSVDFGILFKPNRKLRFGGKLSFPYSLHITGIDSIGSDENEKHLKQNIVYKIPSLFALGFAYKPHRRFTFAVDWHFNQWSKIEIKRGNDGLITNFANGNPLHLGVEYLYNSNGAVLPFRIGYAYQPLRTRMLDLENNDLSGKQVKKNIWTAGFSIITKTILFDLAFEYDSQEFSNDVETLFTGNAPANIFNITQNTYRFTFATVYYF